MLRLRLGWTCCFMIVGASLLACSSSGSDSATTAPADAGAPTTEGDASAGQTLPAGDLGKTCGGGCAGSKICTVTDKTCATGHCLFDGRTQPSAAYCTADCSNAACPAGFVCEDVPFELKRACVRGTSAPAAGSPSVKGSIHLTGAVAKASEPPVPFDVTYAINAAPAPALSTLRCGAAYVTTSSTTQTGFQIYVKACDTTKPNDVLGLVLVEVPFKTGTFTTSDSDPAYPSVTVGIGSPTSNTYGDSRNAAGATLTVSKLVGVKDATTPWKVDEMSFTVSGILKKKPDCTGPTCIAAAETLDVSISLELTAAETK